MTHPIDPSFYTVKRAPAGLGLFAKKEIPKKTCIIEYVGPIVTADEANTIGGQYLFEINSKKTINGAVRSNTARYINHSCRPNCEVEIKKGRVFVYSKKKILPGEELHYDYGKDFFNEYIKPKGCRCMKCEEKRKGK